jgi:hypothetical protein
VSEDQRLLVRRAILLRATYVHILPTGTRPACLHSGHSAVCTSYAVRRTGHETIACSPTSRPLIAQVPNASGGCRGAVALQRRGHNAQVHARTAYVYIYSLVLSAPPPTHLGEKSFASSIRSRQLGDKWQEQRAPVPAACCRSGSMGYRSRATRHQSLGLMLRSKQLRRC